MGHDGRWQTVTISRGLLLGVESFDGGLFGLGLSFAYSTQSRCEDASRRVLSRRKLDFLTDWNRGFVPPLWALV